MVQYSDNQTWGDIYVVQIWRTKIKKNKKELASIKYQFFYWNKKIRLGVNIMNNYFFKPEFENLSQGARLEFVRKLRFKERIDVAECLNLGGKDPSDTVRKYENNRREPELDRVEDLADYFNVSVYAIKRYNFADPNEVIYYHMWEEELFPYSEFLINIDAIKKTFYNEDIIRGLEAWAWGEMRARRENGEITDYDYLEWKLHFDLENLD